MMSCTSSPPTVADESDKASLFELDLLIDHVIHPSILSHARMFEEATVQLKQAYRGIDPLTSTNGESSPSVRTLWFIFSREFLWPRQVLKLIDLDVFFQTSEQKSFAGLFFFFSYRYFCIILRLLAASRFRSIASS